MPWVTCSWLLCLFVPTNNTIINILPASCWTGLSWAILNLGHNINESPIMELNVLALSKFSACLVFFFKWFLRIIFNNTKNIIFVFFKKCSYSLNLMFSMVCVFFTTKKKIDRSKPR